MKITTICTEYPPNYRGGLGIYLFRVIAQLKKDGHDVSLYTMNYPESLPRVEHQDNLTIHRISPCSFTRKGLDKTQGKSSLLAILYNAINLFFFNWHTFRRLRKQSKTEDVGTIAVHDWMCIPAALLAYAFISKDIVFHVHSTEMSMNLHNTPGIFPKIAHLLEDMIGKRARRTIVPSQEIKDYLISDGWKADTIDVVHHGFEDENLLAAANTSPEVINEERQKLLTRVDGDENTKLVVFAGRLTSHKGIMTLVHAMKAVADEVNNVKLVVVGSGADFYQAELKSLIREMALETVVYPYYKQMSQKEVFMHFNMADVCVFPSTYEPFGFVALEAMALAKPTVLGYGFPAVIKAPETVGLADKPVAKFATKNSPSELAVPLITLLTNPVDAASLGKRAQRYVSSQFNWAKTGQETQKVYAQTEGDFVGELS